MVGYHFGKVANLNFNKLLPMREGRKRIGWRSKEAGIYIFEYTRIPY